MAHSMGVISLRITSSVRSSGQWATKLRMATEERNSVRNCTCWHFKACAGLQSSSVLFTAQGSSSALQGDLPGEGVSSGFFCLQLLLGARKHIPPQQQHFGEVITHERGTWEHVQMQCSGKFGSDRQNKLEAQLLQRCLEDLPNVMRAPSSSHPACVRCRESRLFWAAVRRRSSAMLTTNYRDRETKSFYIFFQWD